MWRVPAKPGSRRIGSAERPACAPAWRFTASSVREDGDSSARRDVLACPSPYPVQLGDPGADATRPVNRPRGPDAPRRAPSNLRHAEDADHPGAVVKARTLVRLASVVAVLYLAAPLAAEAQAGRAWRIGYLTPAGVESGNPFLPAFRQRLRELGYIKGQNVTLEIRSADGREERYPGLAAELVRLNVDVIVAPSNPAIAAAQNATTSIPIVMLIASDPVATGFVASLARPGGNITGLTVQSTDVTGKRLQLLKEAVPHLSRVAVLLDPGFPGARRGLTKADAAATVLGLQLKAVEVRSPGELEGAFAAATRNRAGAVSSIAGSMGFAHRGRIAELAVKHRLPTVGPSSEYAEAGWLIGYGPSYTEQFRRAADFVDRILKGTRPADLPVEQPTKFHLAINLKTAKVLGLGIPQSLLLRTDQVIE